MQLNDYTLEILKNFSDIQPNILIEPGAELKTLAEAGNIFARVKLSQEFPAGLRIYDLKEFLSAIRGLDKPNLDIKENHVVATDQVGRKKLRYNFAELKVLTVPKKNIDMPKAEVSFELSEQDLNSLRSMASVLQHEKLTVTNVDNTITITLEDPKDKTCNKYSMEVPGTAESSDFCFILPVSMLKLIPGDYIVSMSSKKISQFKHKTFDLTYWIALDKTSTYAE